MKKLFVYLMVLSILLTSCGKQDDFTETSSEPLYYMETEIYGYNVYEDHTELTEFFGSAYETVEIPEEFYDSEAKKNKPLTVIGESAFNQDSGARYVVIPDTVTEIKSGAFRDCSGMETVTIGKNVRYIRNGAFSRCSTLREIVIPDSVEIIEDFAFFKCATATKLTLGKNLSYIGDNAFEGTVSLEEIKGGDNLYAVGSSVFVKSPWLENLKDEFSGIGKVLLKYNGTDSEITVPEKFTAVADAFTKNTEITSITFPNGFKSIGNNAFAGCNALKKVSIPESVTMVGCNAFTGTPFFDHLEDADGFCVVGDGVLLKYTGSGTSIKIPDNIKYISDAFLGNEMLVEVKIGDNTEIIGRDAFAECSALNMVVISPSVKFIDEYAFSDCDITEFYTSGNKYAYNWAKDSVFKKAIIE